MRITIQGSGRRVTLTKTERAKLSDARDLLRELSSMDRDAGTSCEALCSVLGRITADGAYTAPKPEAANA